MSIFTPRHRLPDRPRLIPYVLRGTWDFVRIVLFFNFVLFLYDLLFLPK